MQFRNAWVWWALNRSDNDKLLHKYKTNEAKGKNQRTLGYMLVKSINTSIKQIFGGKWSISNYQYNPVKPYQSACLLHCYKFKYISTSVSKL